MTYYTDEQRTEYRKKLESLSFGTKVGDKPTERKRVVDERDGSTAGVVTEHWDGRQDGSARPKSIRVKATLVAEEE
jgi:hypothetical protein